MHFATGRDGGRSRATPPALRLKLRRCARLRSGAVQRRCSDLWFAATRTTRCRQPQPLRSSPCPPQVRGRQAAVRHIAASSVGTPARGGGTGDSRAATVATSSRQRQSASKP